MKGGERMKLLYTSDTHVYPAHLDRLLKTARQLRPDAVIIGGDLIPDWRGSIADSIAPHRLWVQNKLLPKLHNFHQTCPQIRLLLDFGNDDIAAARSLLLEADGRWFDLLHLRVVQIAPELAVAGYVIVNPTPFRLKDYEKPDTADQPGLLGPGITISGQKTLLGVAEPHTLSLSDGTMEEDLDKLSATLHSPQWRDHRFMLVSHCPPKDTALDRTHSSLNVGSLAVRRFIERWGSTGRLVASFHGHIHESPRTSGRAWQYLAGVACFNVGQHSKTLRALLLDTENVPASARLVQVDSSGTVKVAAEGEWV